MARIRSYKIGREKTPVTMGTHGDEWRGALGMGQEVIKGCARVRNNLHRLQVQHWSIVLFLFGFLVLMGRLGCFCLVGRVLNGYLSCRITGAGDQNCKKPNIYR